ncbi:hypothetical protein [Clostridium magnum]|uniref:Uncharacterized protein n=1 Tax=Clostridium magnum DSM 2767 TaxID=1121326 RepID=A0A161Y7D3_9CLOT|nr:hypothetical protein [Clostridium magnum]KZL94299.1 hypothetical protein CLMAG_13520 [Clostridium magnum DSM 2767]SHH90691.1 hypothetical protein SAMN02745944_01702 [Clostridium magnum DSM 2767]
MGILKKVIKLGKLAVSSTKENVKSKYLEQNIKNIDKKLEKSQDGQDAHLKIKKENLENKLLKEKKEGNEKRELIKLELKKQVKVSREKRKQENKNLNVVKKLQKEFQEMPIATIANDLAEGISDIEKVKEQVRKNPEDIYSWLQLAETLRFYRKTFLIINGIKAPFDLIGSVLDVGTELIGGSIEDTLDKDKWTYDRAVMQAKKLGATEEQIEEFNKNYNRNILGATVKGTGHMVYKQGEKILKTSERILDFTVDKFIEDKNK